MLSMYTSVSEIYIRNICIKCPNPVGLKCIQAACIFWFAVGDLHHSVVDIWLQCSVSVKDHLSTTDIMYKFGANSVPRGQTSLCLFTVKKIKKEKKKNLTRILEFLIAIL